MGCRAARQCRRALGRRGTALLILGIGKIAYGIGFVLEPLPSTRGLEVLTRYAPVHCWGWVWVWCGAITAGSAFLQVGRDRWGFVAALVPPTLWGTSYGVSFLAGTYPRGWATFAWYATSHVALIVWASRVPEERPLTARRGAERGPG